MAQSRSPKHQTKPIARNNEARTTNKQQAVNLAKARNYKQST